VAQTLVLLTGTLTAWLIAAAVGPTLFHDHLPQAHILALTSPVTTGSDDLHRRAFAAVVAGLLGG
jgi:two-component system sensor histidine kinase BaeS